MTRSLPWHQTQWDLVRAWRASARLPHAILLGGRRGLGKAVFAERLAQALLCQQVADDGAPCGRCRGCLLFAAGSHPDLQWVAPEERGKAIRVDQVRDLGESLSLRSLLGPYRVGVIAPAEAMNRYAANSLLKTLEEPPGNAVLILVSHAPSRLPATVRSRCQRLVFPVPDARAVLPWLREQLPEGASADELLRLAGGSPLEAATIAGGPAAEAFARVERDSQALLEGRSDPIAVADAWLPYGLGEICRWCYRVASDRALARVRGSGSGHRVGNGGELELLVAVMDRCVQSLHALDQGVSLSEPLAVDALVCAWAAARAPATSGQPESKER